MNIGILGLGGIGSLLASRLSLTKHKIICLSSIESNNHIKKNGVKIISSFYGESKFYPKDLKKDENIDYLFIAVKGNNIVNSLLDYRDYFHKDTIAISLLNGFDYREIIRKNFKLKLIVGSIGSVEVFLDEQRNAIHKTNKKPKIELASSDLKLREEILFIKKILIKSGFDTDIIEDENLVIWRKLTRLCILSTITSMYDSNIGYARSNSPSKEIMLKLIDEICTITLKIGYEFNPNKIFQDIESLPYELNTSMQRDIKTKKQTEIEFILKGPLNLGNDLGLDLPTMKYCYDYLLNKIKQSFIDE